MSRPVKLSRRIVSFLIGDASLPVELAALARLIEPRMALDDLVLPQSTVSAAVALVRPRKGERPGAGLLRGPDGAGKKALAEACCKSQGLRLLVVDLAGCLGMGGEFFTAVQESAREAMLQEAAIFFDASAVPADMEVPGDRAGKLRRGLHDFRHPVFFGSSEMPPWIAPAFAEAISIEIQAPGAAEREALWGRALPRDVGVAQDVSVRDMAYRYPLTGGSIQKAAARAVSRARHRDGAAPTVMMEDLVESSRDLLVQRLTGLAQRIPATLGWEDLVLPDEAMERVRELISYARRRRFVFENWGFGAKVPYGRGLSALFSGPPGTGKTMVAGIVARELSMELYRIDLSRITSRYVGETEKNLGRVFDEATRSQSLLLFDEADSLFARRTEVRSSVDRYANLEVNYLLQRVEDFDGVTLLTTNFESSIDEAFKRRLRFRIKFPFPDRDARLRLWKTMFPARAARARDIDFDRLADEYELSGGHIKNAAIRAAFLAADSGGPIAMAHIQKAASLECQEIGKVVRTDQG
jgi:SpoVK/Ycf46/Vps4 family AAA+-type ATPase